MEDHIENSAKEKDHLICITNPQSKAARFTYNHSITAFVVRPLRFFSHFLPLSRIKSQLRQSRTSYGCWSISLHFRRRLCSPESSSPSCFPAIPPDSASVSRLTLRPFSWSPFVSEVDFRGFFIRFSFFEFYELWDLIFLSWTLIFSPLFFGGFFFPVSCFVWLF